MSFANDVMNHYADAPEAERKALAAALAAAGKAMPTPKPGTAEQGQGREARRPRRRQVMSEAAPQTYRDARPDVQLAERAAAIQLAEGVDDGKAMDLALARDPLLAFRYADRDGARRRSRGATVKPPRGTKLCEARPDVELAERAQARAQADGSTYAVAEGAVLAENPKLGSRLRDYRRDENALDELAYRAETILTGNPRMTPAKATDACLAEDPAFRSRVYGLVRAEPLQIQQLHGGMTSWESHSTLKPRGPTCAESWRPNDRRTSEGA